jgi:hypothetical protein
VQSFGASEDAECVALSRDTGSPDGDEWRTQIILTVAAPASEVACHRLQWIHDGEPFSTWIRETDPKGARVYTIARDFRPITSVHADAFSTILHPLATAERGASAPRLTHRMTLRSGHHAAQADIFVFVGADLEALHRTLLALSLTSRDVPFDVHLCVLDQTLLPSLTEAVGTWADLYALPLDLLCYSRRASEAQVVEDVLQGDVPRVFCRAGAVPRHGNWLSLLLKKLKTGNDTIVLGISGHPESGRKTRLPSDALKGIVVDAPRQGAASALQAAVIAPGHQADPDGVPQLFTLEGFLLRQALQTTGSADSSVSVVPELNFTHSGTNCRPDPFEAELDIYSLQEHLKSSLGSKRRRIKI